MAVNISLIGRLGKDAEVRTDNNNRQYLLFTMAINEKVNGVEETTWFDVICDDTHVRLAQYLTKGKLIYLMGTESVSLYNDNNGAPRIRRRVRANRIEFVSVGTSGNTNNNVNEEITCGTLQQPHIQQPNQNVATTVPTNTYGSSRSDDDLPF